jgi:phenylpropionate dioxygenase-like ring-hydroxylating dioxygenase large terminal subunit
MIPAFNNSQVTVQSWYVAALSRDVRAGQVISTDFANRKLAVYRDRDGEPHVLDARCPHLGADLSKGAVIGTNLRCPFHHWTFAANGQCIAIPALSSIPSFAQTFSYPTQEKYGAVWFFNGPEVLFPFPFFAHWKESDLRPIHLKQQTINCHPHVITCNGLDVQHFKTVHRLDFVEDPCAEQLDRFRIQLRLGIRLGASTLFEKSLKTLAGETVFATFTTWGGNLATIEGKAGSVPLLVLFSHRPLAAARSASRTFLFVPRQSGWKRHFGVRWLLAAALKLIMGAILLKDRALLDSLEFRMNLTKADAALAAFIRQVNLMPVFDSTGPFLAQEHQRQAAAAGKEVL